MLGNTLVDILRSERHVFRGKEARYMTVTTVENCGKEVVLAILYQVSSINHRTSSLSECAIERRGF